MSEASAPLRHGRYGNKGSAAGDETTSSLYLVLYVEVLRQVKVDQQDFYCYKTLQMQSIHVFKLIQRGQVECPLFPVLGAGSLSVSSRTNKGMLSIGFRSKEDGCHLHMHRNIHTPWPREWVPFSVFCPPLAPVHPQKSVFGWQSPWYGPTIDHWPLKVQFLYPEKPHLQP